MRLGVKLYALSISTAISLIPITVRAADDNPQPQDTSNLLNLSLQQLSDVEVTSVSKKAEKESQAAAAIYVITQEDIKIWTTERSRVAENGAGPGSGAIQVSQNWAISSRGFNGQFANKLLVLIDGRTVYTPVFSGVWWDVQNLMLEDIERIEVIRGPGATLWGANAVNGVINIITKSAKDTQGTLLTGAAGNQERVAAGGRYGGQVGDLAYRTYAQYFDDNQQHTVANAISGATQGAGAQDQWQNGQGGFRLDWGNADKEGITLQGDAYTGQENALRFLPVTASVSPTYFNAVDDTEDVSGTNILGRWKHQLSAGSDVTLQAYYDDVNRETEYAGYSFHTQTFDLDFQHNWTFNSWNDVTWGMGYRRINSEASNGFYVSFEPEDFYENLYSGFVQDKITLVQDKLFLTFGTKLEHNDFSGFEWEPSVRLAWTPTENQTVWTAVSRAVRSLTQGDQNINFIQGTLPSGTAPNTLALVEVGSLSTAPEEVKAYEVGYRIHPKDNISLDITGFVNEYKNLSSSTQGPEPVVTDPIMGSYIADQELNTSNNSGESHGVEVSATWEATSYAKFSAGYTIYSESIHIVGPDVGLPEGDTPKQQFNARSYIDLPNNLQWDTMLYYVDSLPNANDGFGDTINIPSYLRLDMRLGYSPIKGLDLSLIGQNLLQSEHQEFSPFIYQTPEEIGRSVLAKATLRF